MRRVSKNTIWPVIVGLAMTLCLAGAAYAISVTLLEGAIDLRLDVGDIAAKQARLNVNAQSGAYEVHQKLVEALRDEKGEVLDPAAIMCETVKGSNSQGSFYNNQPFNLNTMEAIVYRSSSNGAADSFLVSYGLNKDALNASGQFRGRVLYTVVPAGRIASVEEQYVDICVNTKRNMTVKVATSNYDSQTVNISSATKDLRGYAVLDISGGTTQQYDVYQQLEKPLANEKGETLPAGSLKLIVNSANGSSRYTSPTDITVANMLVYTSSATGAADSVTISFICDKDALAKIPVGTYKGKLIYAIRSANDSWGPYEITLAVEAKAVFNIEVMPEEGVGFTFSRVKAGTGPLEKAAKVTVTSNTGRPYAVIQKVDPSLVNKEGQTIPLEKNVFLSQAKEAAQPGEIVFSQAAAVKPGDTVIYNSDAVGSSVRFAVIYTINLGLNSNVKAGDYNANINYALVEK